MRVVVASHVTSPDLAAHVRLISSHLISLRLSSGWLQIGKTQEGHLTATRRHNVQRYRTWKRPFLLELHMRQ